MNQLQIKRVKETILDISDLGLKIKNARENDNRSLSQICRECNISRSYWYQLESEDLRAPASEEIIRKIELALDIDLGVNFYD
jgi:transcriptional regulator with XRE-family HTH domain